jgi:hypothetical protein
MPLGELRLLQARTAGGSHNAPRFGMEAFPRKASRGEVSEEGPGHLIIASCYYASQLAHIPLILKLYFFTLTKATHQFYLCIRSMNLGCIFKIVLCSRERPTPAKLANGSPHLEAPTHRRTSLNERLRFVSVSLKNSEYLVVLNPP